jgi:nucleoside-diphosphate-sugar epimerase
MLLEEREIDVYILRPSIVIGHSRTFATTSNAGVYGFMREMYRMQRRFERLRADVPAIRLSGQEESIFSVIPVDIFAREAVAISQAGTRDRIFHITRRNQTTAFETIQLMCNELGLPRPAIAAPDEPLDRVSEMLMSKLTFSKPYLSGYKRFCTRHTDAVTGGAEAEELDALPFTRWYFEYLVAQDASGTRKPRAQAAAAR